MARLKKPKNSRRVTGWGSTVRFTISVFPWQYQKIEEVAEEYGKSKSWVIQQALKQFLGLPNSISKS